MAKSEADEREQPRAPTAAGWQSARSHQHHQPEPCRDPDRRVVEPGKERADPDPDAEHRRAMRDGVPSGDRVNASQRAARRPLRGAGDVTAMRVSSRPMATPTPTR